MASFISAVVTGRRRRDLIMPRTVAAGSLGRRTTVPSGCRKNLTRSPGLSRRCFRIAFGIVAWPLTVIADSIAPSHYISIKVIPPLERKVNSRLPLHKGLRVARRGFLALGKLEHDVGGIGWPPFLGRAHELNFHACHALSVHFHDGKAKIAVFKTFPT